MIISLYTSRIILKVLGVQDYGIYNVVGGIVAMIGVLNSAMTVATQRYLTFELGKGNIEKLQSVFSTSLQMYLILSGLLILFSETIGVWFLNRYLIIPEDRISAANWVFQFSILASVNSLLANPYNACVIAHEKMNVYAYISIIDVVMKLLIVFILPIIPYDRLIVYGFLILFCQIVVRMIYRIYCKKHFSECRIVFRTDKIMFKQILSFSGWNLFGGLATMGKTQGLNIIINMFFSPSVNASRAIAIQVNHAVSLFFSNVYAAFRPQITKYYAQGDLPNMFRLVFSSTRYSFYLMWLIALPVLLLTPQIIIFWLGQTPEYVIVFTRLIILITIIDALAHPLMTVAQAIGDLKLYQTIISGSLLLNIPLSYFALKFGMMPDAVFKISLTISILCLFFRVFIINHLIDFPIKDYLIKVFGNIIVVTFATSIMPVLCYRFFPLQGIPRLVVISIICLLSTLTITFWGGFSVNERKYLKEFIKHKIQK